MFKFAAAVAFAVLAVSASRIPQADALGQQQQQQQQQQQHYQYEAQQRARAVSAAAVADAQENLGAIRFPEPSQAIEARAVGNNGPAPNQSAAAEGLAARAARLLRSIGGNAVVRVVLVAGAVVALVGTVVVAGLASVGGLASVAAALCAVGPYAQAMLGGAKYLLAAAVGFVKHHLHQLHLHHHGH